MQGFEMHKPCREFLLLPGSNPYLGRLPIFGGIGCLHLLGNTHLMAIMGATFKKYCCSPYNVFGNSAARVWCYKLVICKTVVKLAELFRKLCVIKPK